MSNSPASRNRCNSPDYGGQSRHARAHAQRRPAERRADRKSGRGHYGGVRVRTPRRPGQLRCGRCRDESAGPETTAHRPGKTAGRGSRRADQPDRDLRSDVLQARPPRGPSAADGRRHQPSNAVPERPQHAVVAARIQRGSDHQRERHGRGGRADDDVRRQRPAGRPGHQPVGRLVAGHPVRCGRPVQRRSARARIGGHSDGASG